MQQGIERMEQRLMRLEERLTGPGSGGHAAQAAHD
jgi:hypothetical protein